MLLKDHWRVWIFGGGIIFFFVDRRFGTHDCECECAERIERVFVFVRARCEGNLVYVR